MIPSSLLSFERHLRTRGHRPSTIDRYTSCVARLVARSGVPADAVTTVHAYDYLIEQGNRLRVSSSWFNVIFVSIVRWFEMRVVALDLRGLKPQKRHRHRHPPRWLAQDEARRLLAAVPDRRYRLALQVALSTGLRVSELIAMRVDHLDRDRPLLRVPCGKGGDGRVVQVPPTLLVRLRDFWRTYRQHGLIFER